MRGMAGLLLDGACSASGSAGHHAAQRIVVPDMAVEQGGVCVEADAPVADGSGWLVAMIEIEQGGPGESIQVRIGGEGTITILVADL